MTTTIIPNTVINNDSVRNQAMRCARGRYQRELIQGSRRWSGADIVGKARSYADRYAASRHNLLRRLAASGLTAKMIKIGPGRKHVMVISS